MPNERTHVFPGLAFSYIVDSWCRNPGIVNATLVMADHHRRTATYTLLFVPIAVITFEKFVVTVSLRLFAAADCEKCSCV